MLTSGAGVRIARKTGVSVTTKDPGSVARFPGAGVSPGKQVVLILSSDAVAAALLGALVETLGYLVRFYHPPELPDALMRRQRPSVAMVDCEDPTMMNHEILGRARMRDISVVIFGTADALRRVRELALQHQLDTLLMPPSLDTLDETLRRAAKPAS